MSEYINKNIIKRDREIDELYKKSLKKIDDDFRYLDNNDMNFYLTEQKKAMSEQSKRGISVDLLFQFFSINIAIFILASSIAYYVYSDGKSLIGYSEYLNERFTPFLEIVSNVSNINSDMIDNDYEEYGDDSEFYLALNKLMSDFTTKSYHDALQIIKDNERSKEFEIEFDKLIEDIENLEGGTKYSTQIIKNERYISEMNKVDKDVSIQLNRNKGNVQFLIVLFLIAFIMILLNLALLFISGKLRNINSKNLSIANYKYEIISSQIKRLEQENVNQSKQFKKTYEVSIEDLKKNTIHHFNIKIT